MKTILLKPSNYGFPIAVFWACLNILTGCKKGDSGSVDQNITSGGISENSSGIALVSIVHASPGASALDVAVDKNRLNLNSFNYTDRVTYFNAYAGPRIFTVYPRGSNIALFSKSLEIVKNTYYTIFIVDTLSKMDAVLIKDISTSPGPDSTKIRFANMSPDIQAMDLYIQGSNMPIASNINYKNASAFANVKAANDVVFQIKQAGKDNIIATSVKMNIINGNFYTIWIAGFNAKSSGTDAAGNGATAGGLRVGSILH